MIEFDSMREILRLKNEITDGNYTEAIKVANLLCTMCLQDRLDLIENFLSLAISRLIIIQIDREQIHMTHLQELQNALIEIQKKNRLEDSFCIEVDKWQPIYEKALPWALLIALETAEMLDGTKLEELEAKVNFEELQQETDKLIRLTYSFNICEIHKYLHSNWLDRQIYRN